MVVGSAIFAAGMVCLYLVMRTVTFEHGGACASGGPYEIRPGQECQSGLFTLGFTGVIGFMVGALLFFYSTHRYGWPLIGTSAMGVTAAVFFGGLGGSFLEIAADAPASFEDNGDYKFVGVMFLVMAACSVPVVLGPVVYAARTTRKDVRRPPAPAWLAWFAAVVAGVTVGIAVTWMIAS